MTGVGVGELAVVTVEGLDEIIGALVARGYTVIGPRLGDGAIVLGEVTSTTDLPAGWTDLQDAGTYRLERRPDDALFGYAVGPHSARRYTHPPRETMFTVTREDGRLRIRARPPTDPRYAFLGVRACDLAAIEVQDGVLRNGRFADPHYAARREAAFVVAVSCTESASTCFCTSMGTGPAVSGGHDVGLTELIDSGGHRFLVEAGTARGAELLGDVTLSPATTRDVERAQASVRAAAASQTRRLDPDAARDILAANLDHPRWDDVASRCLSCTNCTLVCPTCFCSATEERTEIGSDQAERVRRWDSCFTLDHSHLHGSGPVRSDIRSRYRQWLTHKLATWWDQFGSSGCVGCGRCITWCPVGIDLTVEVAAMATPEPER
jgi:ferredoxin